MFRILGFFLLCLVNAHASDELLSSLETSTQKRLRANGIIYDNLKFAAKQEEGIQLYRELMEQNDEYAAVHLARHYQDGNIYPDLSDADRVKEAVKILEFGAKKGNPNAIIPLAQLNKNHNYELISVPALMGYLHVGEQQDNDNCRCYLADLYRNKDFCDQWKIAYDPEQAVRLYSKSCLAQSEIGPCGLASMYLSGELGSVDFVEAFKVLCPLMKNNDNRARVMWNAYKKETPYANFAALIEKQFDKEDHLANYYIAKGYIYGRYGLKINLEKAEEYLIQGASKENPAKSYYLLATLYGNKNLLFNRKKYTQTLGQLKECNTYLSAYYMLKLTSESKAAEALEHIRLADGHNVCANHFCARFWLGVVDLHNGTKYKSSPLIANKHFEMAISKKYAPTFCFRAETHLFGYMGMIKVDRAKFYLSEAAKKLNSYKAKVMLSNLPSVLESSHFEAYTKSRKYNDFIQLREILFRYN